MFHPDALVEWQALSAFDRAYVREKLQQRLLHPHVPKSRLSDGKNLYKIKRKRPRLRLTYHVNDQSFIVTTISVGKRDGKVYQAMLQRVMDR